MATPINDDTIVEVIETRRVIYKKNRFLFFEWLVTERCDSLYKDIHIKTNDHIEGVLLNGVRIK